MATYISLLRGINVSGQKKIKMADLKLLYESLGFDNVRTYIQSGNVLFDSDELDVESFTSNIESGINLRFGYDVAVLIKTQEELARIVQRTPFGVDSVYITFLFDLPVEIPMDELDKAKIEAEQIEIVHDVAYIHCPSGYGRTKLSNNFLERKLRVSATTRNLNTVNKLLELSGLE